MNFKSFCIIQALILIGIGVLNIHFGYKISGMLHEFRMAGCDYSTLRVGYGSLTMLNLMSVFAIFSGGIGLLIAMVHQIGKKTNNIKP